MLPNDMLGFVSFDKIVTLGLNVERHGVKGVTVVLPCMYLNEHTTEKVKLIQENIRVVQSRQKSYHNKRQKDLKFKEEDNVFLKVTPRIGDDPKSEALLGVNIPSKEGMRNLAQGRPPNVHPLPTEGLYNPRPRNYKHTSVNKRMHSMISQNTDTKVDTMEKMMINFLRQPSIVAVVLHLQWPGYEGVESPSSVSTCPDSPLLETGLLSPWSYAHSSLSKHLIELQWNKEG
ncbi:hypothetical protein CR513_57606, partial [Mucuna pruriens]